VERCEVLVEIDGKEVQATNTRLDSCLVLSKNFVEVVSCFGGNRSDLLVASCIAWDE
jgi:hypothetical protein